MIFADVDQIYDIKILCVTSREKPYYQQELVFPTSTSFLPKEIYNIISVNEIKLYFTRQKLVINNKIINLHNIVSIVAQNTPNVIISRAVLKLPLLSSFSYGDQATKYGVVCVNYENYIKIIMERTTVLN